MRAQVKTATSRRKPVPRSEPTYEVDLTKAELETILAALNTRINTLSEGSQIGYWLDRATSAHAVINWRLSGRQ